ncbi:MAG: hypothetical protein P8X94_04510 [Woeseiaceae bacterium]
MDNILLIHSRKRWPLIAAVALLFAPFMAATSYANDVPVKISYTGSVVPIPVDVDNDDALASVVDGQSSGTFGATMTHIVTEWTPTGLCDDGYVQFALIHSAAVLTFSNGDQLFGAEVGNGWIWIPRVTATSTAKRTATSRAGQAGSRVQAVHLLRPSRATT